MKKKNITELNILYVAPRYHTNQVPIMHGWQKQKCNVMFMAEYEGVSEIHDYVKFHLLKPNLLSKVIFSIIDKKYLPSQAEGKKTLWFFPSFFHTLKTIKEFHPDLVILRERYIVSAVVYLICKILRIQKCILYVQQPIYENKKTKSQLKLYMKRKLFPQVVFSPIYYLGKTRKKIDKSDIWFVPLVAENKDVRQGMQHDYFQGGTIHFLDIGKYREYKNHFFLVDVFEQIKCKINGANIKLTIIGQLSNSDEEEYYTRLVTYVKEKKLDDMIEVRKNVPFKEMKYLYMSHDVLLLPSTYESAGMVILEAMEAGLCVAASIYCGLASYLEEYHCGYIFDINETTELQEILLNLIQQREIIIETGQKGVQVIKNKLCFENYLQALNNLTEKEFDFIVSGYK